MRGALTIQMRPRTRLATTNLHFVRRTERCAEDGAHCHWALRWRGAAA